ncbi:hypothetical protein DH2020_049668 [Rehmannia glutinosa]|uniref:Protein SIEVE ELEMENT OCCLUSION C n=1 Tax=Rehmannia glutinosa TaxID=99300 RepID=A0ABR0U2T8_REHGL
MSLSENALVDPFVFDDFLIREIVRTHDPDDRYLDSGMLLNLLESTFCCTTENVFGAKFDAIVTSDIDLIGSEEPISLILYKISSEILCQCFEDEILHRKTLFLLETLSRYRWDAKVVLALASFACSFGLFWLILQQQSDNALAVSLAILTKAIISFESLSLQHELVDDKLMDITKSKIYVATYWIFRSILVCSSEIADLSNLRLEQVHDKTVIAAWRLHSLGSKLNSLCNELGNIPIKTRFYDKLLHMFKENQDDNQNVLRTLFASQNKFPFKNSSSRDKCGIIELKNKVVILLISKPELLPIDKIFFLVHQTTDFTKTDENYAIIWVPISSSREWSRADKTSFDLFSNSLPWFSVRKPWSLDSTVINYIKHEWNFKEDPIMVVLNENGKVTNSNAMDMVWIWGHKAFPFSSSREKEMWEEANWSVDLLINGINTLSTKWVEEGKNLCIFGSDNLDWIREFNTTMKKIKSASTHLELLYVGCKNPSENMKTIIDTIDQENLCHSLTPNKVNLFWFRLETIKRSIDGQDSTARLDRIATEVTELLELNNNENWAVFGKGSSNDVIKLDQENVAQMGLFGAIRSAFEGDKKCHHNEIIPYEEGLIEKPTFCVSCKSHVEKFVLYKCDE